MDTLRILEKASASLALKNETHIIFTIDRVTQGIRVVGDENSVNFFTKNDPLFGQIKTSLTNIQRQQIQGHQGEEKLYSTTKLHLFAPLGSKNWKGVEKIRAQLSQLLSLSGYGHKEKKRLGSGDPPLGWPYPYIWANFNGPSRATLLMNTQIIQGIDFLVSTEVKSI